MKRNAWRRRRGGTAVLLLIGILILAACTTAAPAPQGGDDAGATTAPTATTGGPVNEAPAVGSAQVSEGKTAEGDWFRGNPNAPITLLEYSDYQCPFCGRHVAQTGPQLDEQFIDTGLIKHVFKNFPLDSIHPQATQAAEAAECAGDQNAFWAMHDRLFASQQEWSGQANAGDLFKQYASDLGLDSAAFASCLDSGQFSEKIKADLQQGVLAGVTGTPAFFVNDWFISGAQPLNVFQETIAAVQRGEAPTPTPLPPPTPTPLPAGADIFSPDPNRPGMTYGGFYTAGEANAPILMVEFSDFQCPYCSQHFREVEPLIKRDWIDTDKARVVFIHFPLAIHPQAPKAGEAAECAGAQGKFWEMHNTLFSRQAEWSGQATAAELFKGYADVLGLDSAAFDACLDSGEMASRVQVGLEMGQQARVRGTPTFYLLKEGQQPTLIPGALPWDSFNGALLQTLNGPQQGPQAPPPSATPGS